eukprot:NODE_176_length_14102_cov_0.889595.p8 type:complete len:232 gc:universal NODE_176_length_14102_cov_0.889595:9360-8665(-)
MLFAICFAVQVLVKDSPKIFEKYHKIEKIEPYYDGLDQDLDLIVVDPLVKDAKELVHNSRFQNIALFYTSHKVLKQYITELGISQLGKTKIKVSKDNYHVSANSILDKKPAFTYEGTVFHGTNDILSWPLITGYVEDSVDKYVGSQLEIIRLFQTRNNTRIAILPKELLEIKESHPLIEDLLKWVFKHKNMLDIKVGHFKVDENNNKMSGQLKEYKIKDTIVIPIYVASRY